MQICYFADDKIYSTEEPQRKSISFAALAILLDSSYFTAFTVISFKASMRFL